MIGLSNKKPPVILSPKGTFKPIIWYPAIGLLVAVLTPESAVTGNEFLNSLLANSKGWIPAIGTLGAISDFPVVTGLYLLVMWSLLPFAVVKLTSTFQLNMFEDVSIMRILLALFLGMLSILALLTFIYWFPYHPNEWQRSIYSGRGGAFVSAIIHLRSAMGILLGAVFLTFALFVSGILKAIQYLILRTIH